jgi:predicted nuclease of predicted toxin-antitoxin system
MKILLDENIDVRLKNFFPVEYTVYTVRDMGWNGIKNGELLLLLKENNFDAWIVVDKNIPYQQNTANLSCSVIVLDVYRNTLKHLLPLVPQILNVLNVLCANDKIIVIKEERI